jgi:hypothetical protein
MQILMNENNKSFYPLTMFEFIHHPKYGCRDLKGLRKLLQRKYWKLNIKCDLDNHNGRCLEHSIIHLLGETIK